MTSRLRASFAAAISIAFAGCMPQPTPPPYDPFKAPREQVGATLLVVGLAPMQAPRDLPCADLAKGRFLATIEARLREAGLIVIPASEVDPVLKDVVAWRDGFYDPRTGKLDGRKVQGAIEEAFERLGDKFGRIDAIVHPELRVTAAPLQSDWASWNGATEYGGTGDGKKVFFLNRHSGRLRALSLVVFITGKDGAELYAGAGGVQLLEKVDIWGARIPVAGGELLSDEQRNWNAVVVATDPLLTAVREGRAGRAAAPPPPGGPPPAAAPSKTPAAAPP